MRFRLAALILVLPILLVVGVTLRMAQTHKAETPAPNAKEIVTFAHVVSDLAKSVGFYHGVLGLELAAQPTDFDASPISRSVELRLPGSRMILQLVEYEGTRKPAHARIQDPGATILKLRIPDNPDTALARARKAGARVLASAERYLLLQDDDGFVVELSGDGPAGTDIEVAVADVDKTAAAYRALGFEPVRAALQDNDRSTVEIAGAVGGQIRRIRAAIPDAAAGATASITFLEFQQIAREPLQTGVREPGATVLMVDVRDVSSLLPKLTSAGFGVVSSGDRTAIVRDPNNLFLQLYERSPR